MYRNITLTVNKEARTVEVAPNELLLDVLRERLGIKSPKIGCERGDCGACTVLLDGKPIRSCVLLVSVAAKGNVTTIEGLGTPDKLHPLQAAFIAEQACQCGYCGNGMVMTSKALLDANPHPTEAQIRQALNGHLCRCASHNRIVRAVQRASKELA